MKKYDNSYTKGIGLASRYVKPVSIANISSLTNYKLEFRLRHLNDLFSYGLERNSDEQDFDQHYVSKRALTLSKLKNRHHLGVLMSSMDKITYKQTRNAILYVKWYDIRKNHRENLDDLVSLLVNEFVIRDTVDQYWETRNSG